jgi:sugar O-acyltransferase (sialic acid O-acetyltransferase NeuD family)
VKHEVLLLGGGGHAQVVADAAIASGLTIVGFLDDDPERFLRGYDFERRGPIQDPPSDCLACAVHAATGDASLREAWLRPFTNIMSIVHPTAVLSPRATVGRGVFIAPRAILNASAVVQHGAIINSGAIIEHDVTVEAYAHVAPGAIVCGGALIGRGALVGAGAVVLPGVTVPHGATVPAGSVATRQNSTQ